MINKSMILYVLYTVTLCITKERQACITLYVAYVDFPNVCYKNTALPRLLLIWGWRSTLRAHYPKNTVVTVTVLYYDPARSTLSCSCFPMFCNFRLRLLANDLWGAGLRVCCYPTRHFFLKLLLSYNPLANI